MSFDWPDDDALFNAVVAAESQVARKNPSTTLSYVTPVKNQTANMSSSILNKPTPLQNGGTLTTPTLAGVSIANTPHIKPSTTTTSSTTSTTSTFTPSLHPPPPPPLPTLDQQCQCGEMAIVRQTKKVFFLKKNSFFFFFCISIYSVEISIFFSNNHNTYTIKKSIFSLVEIMEDIFMFVPLDNAM